MRRHIVHAAADDLGHCRRCTLRGDAFVAISLPMPPEHGELLAACFELGLPFHF